MGRSQKRKGQISSAPSLVNVQDSAGVALSVSRRLIAVGKMRKIVNIEAGLEFIAFGMAICSLVSIFYVYLKHSDELFLD